VAVELRCVAAEAVKEALLTKSLRRRAKIIPICGDLVDLIGAIRKTDALPPGRFEITQATLRAIQNPSWRRTGVRGYFVRKENSLEVFNNQV